jgi:glucan 1,3-beta-glucosidase
MPLVHKNESVQPWNETITTPNSHVMTNIAAASCGGPVATNPGTFWYESITHNGISPFINNGGSWEVFRNVKTDFGAQGDGVSDDAQNIQNAINGKIVRQSLVLGLTINFII